MANPYESPTPNVVATPQLGSAVGQSFYFSLVLAFLLFLLLPLLPLTYFVAIFTTIWALGGVILSWRRVRGWGRLAAIALNAFYAFMVYVAWQHLLSRL